MSHNLNTPEQAITPRLLFCRGENILAAVHDYKNRNRTFKHKTRLASAGVTLLLLSGGVSPVHAAITANDVLKSFTGLAYVSVAILSGPSNPSSLAYLAEGTIQLYSQALSSCPIVRTVIETTDNRATQGSVFAGEMENVSPKEQRMEKQVELEVSANVTGGIDIKAIKLGVELGTKVKYTEKVIFDTPANSVYQVITYATGIRQTGYQERLTLDERPCKLEGINKQPFVAFIPTSLGYRFAPKQPK